MMFDIVQFIGSGNEYLISCDKSRSEIFRLLDGLPSQTAAMDENIIECALRSNRLIISTWNCPALTRE